MLLQPFMAHAQTVTRARLTPGLPQLHKLPFKLGYLCLDALYLGGHQSPCPACFGLVVWCDTLRVVGSTPTRNTTLRCPELSVVNVEAPVAVGVGKALRCSGNNNPPHTPTTANGASAADCKQRRCIGQDVLHWSRIQALSSIRSARPPLAPRNVSRPHA